MQRKIIQIAASQSENGVDRDGEPVIDHNLYALSNDGIVFRIDLAGASEWEKLPPLPQPEVFKGAKGKPV